MNGNYAQILNGAKNSCTINRPRFLTSLSQRTLELVLDMDFNVIDDEFDMDLVYANISDAANDDSLINQSLYIKLNSAANAVVFALGILPPSCLAVACIIAMIIADDLNLPMRILLLNIFSGETLELIAVMVRNLGFPARALNLRFSVYSCHASNFLGICATVQKQYAIAFYSVSVYVFIVYGVRKLNLRVILPFIVASWIGSAVVAVRPFLDLHATYLVNGICVGNPGTIVYWVGFSISGLHLAVLTSVISIFCALTYRYVKKNVLEENVEIKQAVAKNLYFMTLATIFTALVPTSFLAIAHVVGVVGGEAAAILAIVLDQLFQFVVMVPSFIVILAATVILKPLHLAMMQLAAGIRRIRNRNTE